MQPVRTLALVLCSASLVLASCKRHEAKVATIHRPAGTLPTTQAMEKDRTDEIRAKLWPLANLGTGVNGQTPDGEIWTRYSNGIMIHDIKRGEGMSAQWGQTVTISYVGTFPTISGKPHVFDESKPDQPLVFQLGSKDLIQGMSLGILNMNRGGKRRIFVPPELAYGAMGNLPRSTIPPNQALIFEVELLRITGDPIEMPSVDTTQKAEEQGPPIPAGLAPPTTPSTVPATAP